MKAMPDSRSHAGHLAKHTLSDQVIHRALKR